MSVTEVPELRIELGPAAEAIERAGRRVAELLSHAEEAMPPVSASARQTMSRSVTMPIS